MAVYFQKSFCFVSICWFYPNHNLIPCKSKTPKQLHCPDSPAHIRSAVCRNIFVGNFWTFPRLLELPSQKSPTPLQPKWSTHQHPFSQLDPVRLRNYEHTGQTPDHTHMESLFPNNQNHISEPVLGDMFAALWRTVTLINRKEKMSSYLCPFSIPFSFLYDKYLLPFTLCLVRSLTPVLN